MKKQIIALVSAAALVCCACSRDTLDTTPTDMVSGSGMFSNASAALVPLNGIYRMMFQQGWSTESNTQQCDGLSAWNLCADVMGDDCIMGATGNGWYWYDCTYGVKSRYTSSGWRSYDLWNAYYTIISNANYIIAAESTMEGTPADVNYVIGQAYALRAYSYNQLALYFSRVYIKDDLKRLKEKCVPLYTEPTQAGTPGQPRSSVAEVYKLIREDIDKACDLLATAGRQQDKTHIDYRVANALRARICMITEEWDVVLASARKAQEGYTIGTGADLTGGLNDVAKNNVMWGATMITDQLPGWGPIFYHMDAYGLFLVDGTQNYAFAAPKCLNSDLYARLGEGDIRRNWWLTEEQQIDKYGTNPKVTLGDDNMTCNLINNKIRFSDASQALGDKLWMRVEEMYLAEAEALCRLGQDAEAIAVLEGLVKTRDAAYACAKTGTNLGALTGSYTGSLLEEILIQRRIELWGEFGRIYDIKRLRQGFTRTTGQGWPTAALIPGVDTQDPDSWAWVLSIPQKEFDGNVNMDLATDQNPLGVKGPWDESNIYVK